MRNEKIIFLTLAVCILIIFSLFGISMPAQADINSGDNYPTEWRYPIPMDSVVDTWGYLNRECTSWVAWALKDRNGFEAVGLGNAANWGHNGYTVNNTPAVGAVAWWDAQTMDIDFNYNVGDLGHVAYVKSVNSNGTVTIEEYNHLVNGVPDGAYHTRDITPSNPQYIHFQDITQLPLESISITTLPTKIVYNVGDALDLSGMIVTGTYGTGEGSYPQEISSSQYIISGFDSSAPATDQVITVTVDGKTDTFLVQIRSVSDCYYVALVNSQEDIVIQEGISGIGHVALFFFTPNQNDADMLFSMGTRGTPVVDWNNEIRKYTNMDPSSEDHDYGIYNYSVEPKMELSDYANLLANVEQCSPGYEHAIVFKLPSKQDYDAMMAHAEELAKVQYDLFSNNCLQNSCKVLFSGNPYFESYTRGDFVSTILNDLNKPNIAFFSIASDFGAAVPTPGQDLLTDFAADITTQKFSGTLANGQTMISKYSGSEEFVNIPNRLLGAPITSIGSRAFQGCSSMKNVVIPDSVKDIGMLSFCNCGALNSITFPDSVTSIGVSAFAGCRGLTSIEFGQGVTSIPDTCWSNSGGYYSGVFEGCTNLTSITIPDNITHIGSRAFKDCTNLESIDLGNGLNGIGGMIYYINALPVSGGAFTGCTKLNNFTIPEGVAYIGSGAFDQCTSLTEISLPDSLTGIGRYAFRGCCNLAVITMGNNVTDIQDYAFAGTDIVQINIPDSVTNIGSYVFSNTPLTSLTIPRSVSHIVDFAFRFSGLSQINVDIENQSYSSQDGILFNKDRTRLIYCPSTKAGSYSVPETVTDITKVAFEGCGGLTDVVFPNSLLNIEDNAFSQCSGLKNVILPSSLVTLGGSVFQTSSLITTMETIQFNSADTQIKYVKPDPYPNQRNTIQRDTTILGHNPSTAYDYAVAYGHRFIDIDDLINIEITSPATKLIYFVGEALDITGLVVTGTHGDGSTAMLAITEEDIGGFDSSTPVANQTLTISVDGKTTTYNISVVASPDGDLIEVNSGWCYVSANATDQLTGDVTITANSGYDVIVGPYNATVIVTLPEGVTFSDNDTNTKTFADVGLSESTPLYLYGDTDFVIDVGVGVSGEITADVRVYVQDGGEYVLDETESQIIAKVAVNNTDATLIDLCVDGTTLPDFDPATTIYNVVLPIGTTVIPTVTANVNDPGGATAEITPAISLPGTTNILVTAVDGTTTETYSINFTVVLPITVSPESPNVNVDATPLQVTVPAEVNNASLSTSPVDGAVFLPQISVQTSTSMGAVTVHIMSETEVTGPTDWDGTINLPRVVDPGSVTVTPENGNEANVSGAIEIGLPDTALTFSKPVRVMLAGQGGKKAGWILNETFTPITYEMASDTAEALDTNPDGYVTVGDDLVIWTTHFTTFVAYTETPLTGCTLSGQVLVEGDDLTEGQTHYSGGVSIELKQGEEIKYSGISSEAADLASNGSFSIAGIAAGDYTVVISKAGYLTRSFSLTINSDLTLTTTSNQYLNRIYLLAGDIVSDEYNVIAASDVNYILSKFNSNSTQVGFDPQVDIVKDQYNVISAADVNLMLSNFNKNSTQYPADIIY